MPGVDTDDSPTIKELFRHFVDFREEWRSDKAQMVRKDVHTVEHDALLARLARNERDLTAMQLQGEVRDKERANLRNQFYFSVVAAGLSLIVGFVLAVVK